MFTSMLQRNQQALRRYRSARDAGLLESDPYYANVVSVLNFQGTNGSTTFADAKSKTWTATGNAQLSTAQAKFGVSSLLLDGTGDFIHCTGGADFQFGISDFTIELWIYLTTLNQNGLFIDTRFDGVTTSFALYDNSVTPNTVTPTFYTNSNDRAVGANLSASQWYHLEIARVSGQSRFFIDGVQYGSAYADSINYSSTQIRLGHNYTATSASTSGMIGHIGGFRATKGVGRHTSNFTPPTSAFPSA